MRDFFIKNGLRPFFEFRFPVLFHNLLNQTKNLMHHYKFHLHAPNQKISLKVAFAPTAKKRLKIVGVRKTHPSHLWLQGTLLAKNGYHSFLHFFLPYRNIFLSLIVFFPKNHFAINKVLYATKNTCTQKLYKFQPAKAIQEV